MKKLPLYLYIIFGMLLGVGWGVFAIYNGLVDFTIDWIKPWGVIFMKLLKLIAVPLIFVSLVKGISSLTNISQLSKIGFRTIAFYIISTIIAVSIGLLLVNSFSPGKAFPEDVRTELLEKYKNDIENKQEDVIKEKNKGPLRFFVDLVPENIVDAASENRRMLEVIFFALIFGIAMVSIPKEKTTVVKQFFDGLNDIILKLIDIIMWFAPIGVLALMAGIIVEIAGNEPTKTIDIFKALGYYSLTVIIGLLLMILIIYPILLRFFSKTPYFKFLRGIFPAQMLAFSTSSSAATLPVTMECCEENLHIEKKVTSFVLPIGATINMDGTSLYQAVAAVFIAQVFGYDLSLVQQLTIILTATLASIGSAAVPGAGIVMLIIVLESIGVPSAGIALIFAIDRPLDMLRTVVNITGDSTVASIIDYQTEKKN